MSYILKGNRFEIPYGAPDYPSIFKELKHPPKCIYGIGEKSALTEGISIIGARKATPYGKSVAYHFAGIAAEKEICVISGGALGCDSEGHRAAVDKQKQSVVVLGGGCDAIYPKKNFSLFQAVIDNGGAVISEQAWETPPMRYMFRARNRLIAALARATLIVEAGLPSGTFSTADEALSMNRDVLVVPGAITSANSMGANRLIYQGATPIIDNDTFLDQLEAIYGIRKAKTLDNDFIRENNLTKLDEVVLSAIYAEPLSTEDILDIFKESGSSTGTALQDMMMWLNIAKNKGWISQYPDGKYGPYLNK